MKCLRRNATEQRHEITGVHDGIKVTLVTNRDFPRLLDDVHPGDFVTWRGVIDSEVFAEQRWTVTRVEEVACPDQ